MLNYCPQIPTLPFYFSDTIKLFKFILVYEITALFCILFLLKKWSTECPELSHVFEEFKLKKKKNLKML